jgi:hypothetical protein
LAGHVEGKSSIPIRALDDCHDRGRLDAGNITEVDDAVLGMEDGVLAFNHIDGDFDCIRIVRVGGFGLQDERGVDRKGRQYSSTCRSEVVTNKPDC